MTKQLFKLPVNPPAAKQLLTPQQKESANKAKLIALGLFIIMGIPLFIKVYSKGPYTSLFIGVYWFIIILIAFFSLGAFIKKKYFNKPKWLK